MGCKSANIATATININVACALTEYISQPNHQCQRSLAFFSLQLPTIAVTEQHFSTVAVTDINIHTSLPSWSLNLIRLSVTHFASDTGNSSLDIICGFLDILRTEVKTRTWDKVWRNSIRYERCKGYFQCMCRTAKTATCELEGLRSPFNIARSFDRDPIDATTCLYLFA